MTLRVSDVMLKRFHACSNLSITLLTCFSSHVHLNKPGYKCISCVVAHRTTDTRYVVFLQEHTLPKGNIQTLKQTIDVYWRHFSYIHTFIASASHSGLHKLVYKDKLSCSDKHTKLSTTKQHIIQTTCLTNVLKPILCGR